MTAAPSPADDIATPRLALRLMDGAVIDACLAGDLALASARLKATVPAEVASVTSGLTFGKTQLAAHPDYAPWSARAIILAETGEMAGVIRFHSPPDPDYLRPYAVGAVEIGYTVFMLHRRRGYAREALAAAMDWARVHFGVRGFVASVSPDNTASLGVIAAFGFNKVGEQVDDIDGLEFVFLRIT